MGVHFSFGHLRVGAYTSKFSKSHLPFLLLYFLFHIFHMPVGILDKFDDDSEQKKNNIITCTCSHAKRQSFFYKDNKLYFHVWKSGSCCYFINKLLCCCLGTLATIQIHVC